MASKLTAPRLPGWMVTRPRLDKRMAEGAGGPLTVVSGPPGAGKTMALASWAAASRVPERIAWVALDDYDNRPGRFWSHVVKALRQASAAIPGTVPELPHAGTDGRTFLPRLATALAALEPPLVLVLDDLHLLTAPGPLEELAYLLKHAWPGLHLVAAARMDPLLPLHRYRLAGELAEIRAGDLAFTVSEAAQLMAQHGLALPAGAVNLITERVEGWAAGLRLAALSLDGHPDPQLFIKNLAAEDNALTSYLVDEILDAQPSAARDLMLRTSILDQVSADLARELTGDEQAGSTLAALARSGGFVQPLGHGWYRYHSMLAEVLRLKLRRESPGRTPGLHKQAASWYRRNGPLAKAVTHAAQINDWQLAAQIVVDDLAVGELLQPGGGPVADALRRIPSPRTLPGEPAQPPSLLAAAALELRDDHGQAASSLLAAAEKLLGRLPADREIPSRLAAAMLRLAAYRRSGDLGAASAAVAQAEAVFEQLPDALRRRCPDTGAHVLSGRGVVEFWSGDPGAGATFASAAAGAPEGSWEWAACHGHLALIEALRGRLSRAAELAEGGKNPPADDRAHPPSAAAVALALVHLDRNELHAWRSHLKQAEAALLAVPDRLMSTVACLVAARGALAQDHGPAAAELIQRARDGWSPPPWLDHLLTVATAQASTATGDIQEALDAAHAAGAGSALDADVALARALLAAGNLHAARQALGSAADVPPGEASDPVQLEAYLTDSLLSYRSNDQARGRRSLERALRLGRAERRRLPFVVNRAWILPALRGRPDLASAYHGILQPGPARRGKVPAHPASASRPEPMIVERLSDREREVLQFASSMLSTEEIAGAMYLSVNTIKSHLRSIFRKLEATGRGEAVRRARSLGMI